MELNLLVDQSWCERGAGAHMSHPTGGCMSFTIYLIGYIVLIAGLAVGASLLHIQPKWIGVGILCLIGIAIIHGVTATRSKDPA
jgi:hypothetical protein